jgi:hypothetical protein
MYIYIHIFFFFFDVHLSPRPNGYVHLSLFVAIGFSIRIVRLMRVRWGATVSEGGRGKLQPLSFRKNLTSAE